MILEIYINLIYFIINKVFVAPSKTRNPFLSVLEIVFPIIAACPLPRPGRKLQIGEATSAPKTGLKILVFDFDIFCFGIFVLFFMLVTNIEAPNNPVSKGSNGSLSDSRFSTHSPKNPESKKTSKAADFFFSVDIRKNEARMSKPGINKGMNL